MILKEAEAPPRPQRSLAQAFVKFREVGIIIFIVALAALVSLRNPAFLTAANFRDIVLNSAILVIVALAQAMVIITRGVDLSVGSTIGLTAMMVSYTVVAFPDLPPLLTVPLGMALGAALGGLNGLIIAGGGVPPIIATLGTLSIYRGLIFLYSGTKATINAFELPASFRRLAKDAPLGVPNLILVAIAVAIVVYYFLRYARLGRDIYTVGSNPDAARFAGIPIKRTIFLVYVISGALSGLAGVLWAARFESAQTNTALGFELQTVAAAVVGGVSILGGTGTVVGATLAAILISAIGSSLIFINVSPYWLRAVQGVLILLTVLADLWRRARQARRR
jgi:rhamnose transport system permease protein